MGLEVSTYILFFTMSEEGFLRIVLLTMHIHYFYINSELQKQRNVSGVLVSGYDKLKEVLLDKGEDFNERPHSGYLNRATRKQSGRNCYVFSPVPIPTYLSF